jgi:hypothetical protein
MVVTGPRTVEAGVEDDFHYFNVELTHDGRGWADATLPAEQAEAAIVLRRACFVGNARGGPMEARTTAPEMTHMTSACFTFQPPRAEVAVRHTDSVRDFDAHPEHLLSEGPDVPDGSAVDEAAWSSVWSDAQEVGT